MNYTEQKEKAYKELFVLLGMIPFKYAKTREDIRVLMDSLNNEVWLR